MIYSSALSRRFEGVEANSKPRSQQTCLLKETLSIAPQNPHIKGGSQAPAGLCCSASCGVSMCDTRVIKPVYGQSTEPFGLLPSATQDAKESNAKAESFTSEGDLGDRHSSSGKRKKGLSGKKSRSKLKKALSWRQSNRSRRLIANARERSRIHIMSEAFEGLRRAVPCYSSDQKLSKLAILRLATSYISALSYLAESDTSKKSLKHFAESVDQCTQALQTEGRARRKE